MDGVMSYFKVTYVMEVETSKIWWMKLLMSVYQLQV